MDGIKTTALIGLGAMGVFFAPRIAADSESVFFVIADGERKKRLEQKGVTVNGVNYRFDIKQPSCTDTKADLIIVAVKGYSLEQAIEDIKNFVGENTQILCVINGIDSERRLEAVYGREHTLYSYMRISIVMKDGCADFNPNGGCVHFGEKRNDVYSDRVRNIKDYFDRCRIPYKIDDDMVRGMWFKFMCNVGENMTCASFGIPFGAFRTSSHANYVRVAAMKEVVAIANRLGIDIGQADIDAQQKTIMKLPYFNKPSTLQDLEAGKRTEVDMFSGTVVRLGEKYGIDTPVNRILYNCIRVLEDKNDGCFDHEVEFDG